MKRFTTLLVIFFIALMLGCGSEAKNDEANDQLETPFAPDSMPVVNPGGLDTSRTVRTPPTNDSNNAYPDTLVPEP